MYSLNKLHQGTQLKLLLRKFDNYPTWWKHSIIEILFFIFFFNFETDSYLHEPLIRCI